MSLYESLFEEFNKRGVRYIVAGGFAVVLHGYPRLTVDLDLLVDLRQDEATKTIETLTSLGFRPRLPVDPADFANPERRRQWIQERNLLVFSMFDPDDPLRMVDLFVDEPAPFEELWSRAVMLSLGSTMVRVVSLEDLITMKREAGRPRDLDDVAALEVKDPDGQ